MKMRSNRFLHWLSDDFSLSSLAKSLAAGITLYVMEIFVVISFAALIFSGALSQYVAYGVGWIVAGDALICLALALFSGYRGTIALEQDAPGVIVALTAAALVESIPVALRPAQSLPTVVVMIVSASLLTGIFFIVLGKLRLGDLARYLPYPVLGGFLAGTGWLLATGGISVMTGSSLSLALFEPQMLIRWLPGLILGMAIYIIAARSTNALAVPLFFLASVLVFHLVARLIGTSANVLQEGGWLLGPFNGGSQWVFPLNQHFLANTNWSALAGQITDLFAVLIVSMIALLLNANSLELVVQQDIDLNKELTAAGIGNLASGLVGGTVGYHTISLSTLNYKMTNGKRLAGLLTALFLGLSIAIGTGYLGLIPKMVVGAMLVYLGLLMLIEWIYRAWKTFNRLDFLIILTILVIIALKGFMLGIAVGVVMTVIMFVVNYSQVNVIKQAFSGAFYRSRMQRSRQQWETVARHSSELYILKLQGFIFFGTAHKLYNQIRSRTADLTLPTPRWILVDFAEVSGLDSTGLLSFNKLLQLAQDKKFTLVLTGLNRRVSDQFIHGGIDPKSGAVIFFPDIDHGYEWCENQILSESPAEITSENLEAMLGAVLPGEKDIPSLIEYLERREIQTGEYLMRQGEEPDWLYFVESGQVTAQLEKENGEIVRLQSMRGGNVVGELGLFLEIPRTAAVIADEPSVVYGLSKARMEEMEQSSLAASHILHHLIVKMLAERVVNQTQIIEALEG
jgi:sulfate permease, SulP family